MTKKEVELYLNTRFSGYHKKIWFTSDAIIMTSDNYLIIYPLFEKESKSYLFGELKITYTVDDYYISYVDDDKRII